MKTVINIVNENTVVKNDETYPNNSLKLAAIWTIVGDIFAVAALILLVVTHNTQDPTTFLRFFSVVKFLWLATTISLLVSTVIYITIKKFLFAMLSILGFTSYLIFLIVSLL